MPKYHPMLRGIFQNEGAFLRLHLMVPFGLRRREKRTAGLSGKVLDLIRSRRIDLVHVHVCGSFLERWFSNPKDRERLWSDICDLPNVRKLTLSGSYSRHQVSFESTTLINLLRQFRLCLEGLVFNFVRVQAKNEQEMLDFCNSMKDLAQLRFFEANYTSCALLLNDTNATPREFTNAAWKSVAGLPKIETMALKDSKDIFSIIDKLSTSTSLKHLSCLV